jgi:signal transduction histidine kinase
MLEPQIELLLVDDDEVDRELVCRLLSEAHLVREAATAMDAMAAIELHRPDCVLLDYRLPDMDGLQLLPLLTRTDLPVIILTGEESPEIIVQAIQRGAQNYLVKGSLTQISLRHAITGAIEKAALKRDVEEKNRQLRRLASALALAEQRERRRVSQILHDHVQQILYGIQMRSQLIALDAAPDERVREHLGALQALVSDAILTTRTLTVELSPPVLQNEGLAAALEWLVSHMAERYHLHVTLQVETDYQGPDDDLRMLLFQLVRELLFNVVKHSGVNEAQLTLSASDENLIICVADCGRGFEPQLRAQTSVPGGGFGLYSVRERLALFGGQLKVESGSGKGVRATVLVPREPLLPAEMTT